MGAARLERAARALRIGGFTPLSTTDWPGQLAAVVFCQGCPWRCAYCHNPHLLPSRGLSQIAWEAVLAFLRRREGLLDAVVFSGGEPLAQPGLAGAMEDARRMGFRVGLHTSGAYPSRLAHVLPFVDWVGLDVKAPFAEYASITGAPESGSRALKSVALVSDSGVDHELRTTFHPRLLAPGALERLADELVLLGAGRYALQAFRAQGCSNAGLVNDADSYLPDRGCLATIAAKFQSFEVRSA